MTTMVKIFSVSGPAVDLLTEEINQSINGWINEYVPPNATIAPQTQLVSTLQDLYHLIVTLTIHINEDGHDRLRMGYQLKESSVQTAHSPAESGQGERHETNTTTR